MTKDTTAYINQTVPKDLRYLFLLIWINFNTTMDK